MQHLPSLRAEITPGFFPPSTLWFWSAGSVTLGPAGRWTKQTQEGLYLDARSPNRLSGSEEAEEAVGTECRGEKKKTIGSLCHPAAEDPGDAFPTPCANSSSRALRGGLACRAPGPQNICKDYSPTPRLSNGRRKTLGSLGCGKTVGSARSQNIGQATMFRNVL